MGTTRGRKNNNSPKSRKYFGKGALGQSTGDCSGLSFTLQSQSHPLSSCSPSACSSPHATCTKALAKGHGHLVVAALIVVVVVAVVFEADVEEKQT